MNIISPITPRIFVDTNHKLLNFTQFRMIGNFFESSLHDKRQNMVIPANKKNVFCMVLKRVF